MPKTKISEFDVDPANNTDINSINIAEGCAPSGINNAIRQLMSDLKEFQTGAGGDPFNGAVNGTVGATTPNTAVVTTLTANTSVSTDTISEKTSATGVTIDGVLLKDNAVSASSGFTQSGTFNSASNFGFKNRIINGAMVIDQRNAGASVTPNNSYTLDRWTVANSQTGKFTVQQNAGSVTPPTGFTNYLGVTSTSAYSVSSSDFFLFSQAVEGFNASDLGWGTASASAVTLSFWVRSSLTGTFGGAIENSAGNRSYPFSFTISAANTWEQKSITIAGDTSGTWLTNNGVGLWIRFSLGAGSTWLGTAGSWSGSRFFSATGATSVVGTNGATFYITGVQLEKGSTATSFDYRPYGTELQLCQRYYVRFPTPVASQFLSCGQSVSSTQARFPFAIPCPLRTTPSINYSGIGINDTSVQNAVTAIASISTSANNVAFLAACASGLTAPRPVLLNSSGTASDYIDFSAEL
jgi:hypothetical protein